MVYIYVCKRFRVSMDFVSGRDQDWVNNLLASYCKHARINGKLERAEINPKKRTAATSFDSSSEVFKINIVYKVERSGLRKKMLYGRLTFTTSSYVHYQVAFRVG